MTRIFHVPSISVKNTPRVLERSFLPFAHSRSHQVVRDDNVDGHVDGVDDDPERAEENGRESQGGRERRTQEKERGERGEEGKGKGRREGGEKETTTHLSPVRTAPIGPPRAASGQT